MSGWNLKKGYITDVNLSNDRIWSLINFVFSDSSRKRNSYKFGLIKALLDNAFNGKRTESGVMIIPDDFEPLNRILRATIPERESQLKSMILFSVAYLQKHYL